MANMFAFYAECNENFCKVRDMNEVSLVHLCMYACMYVQDGNEKVCNLEGMTRQFACMYICVDACMRVVCMVVLIRDMNEVAYMHACMHACMYLCASFAVNATRMSETCET